MTQSETSGFIQDMFLESSLALFKDLSSEVDVVADDNGEDFTSLPCVSFIDAMGRDIEIMLSLTVPMSVLALTYPVSDIESIKDEDLEDWLAELSNMLMGKLKAQLHKHQVEIRLGLPESFFDVETSKLVVKPSASSASYSLLVDQVPVKCAVHIDQLNPDLRLSKDTLSANDEGAVDHGSLELF